MITKTKDCSFQSGDKIIFPPDEYGRRHIRIFPSKSLPDGSIPFGLDHRDDEVYRNIMHSWMERGAESYAGKIPKCGYVVDLSTKKLTFIGLWHKIILYIKQLIIRVRGKE